ncbi:hypothetical protein VTL71DRAFT_15826 [Oculimacula yallundae]|uniref:C2H2-type domain-containing protein n=1 Tax=Oculimacula yallundae TaxID=86028 RepID=A0ABR4CCS1_9HELO
MPLAYISVVSSSTRLDNNQERLNLQYVSPWQVELKPNPINFVCDTYNLHPYFSTQANLPPHEPRTSTSGSEDENTTSSLPILSSSSLSQSPNPLAGSSSHRPPNQSSLNQAYATVTHALSPVLQQTIVSPIPLLPAVSAPAALSTFVTNPNASVSTATVVSPSLQQSETSSPKSSSRGQSSFQCTLCSQAFSKQHLLNRHKTAIHHRRFVCNVQGCDHRESFGLRKDLTRHQTSRHPLLFPATVYHCTYQGCAYGPGSPKSFRRKDNRDRHVREH